MIADVPGWSACWKPAAGETPETVRKLTAEDAEFAEEAQKRNNILRNRIFAKYCFNCVEI